MRMSTNTFRAFVKHLNKHNQIEVKVKMYSLRQMHLLHKSWESHQFWIKSLCGTRLNNYLFCTYAFVFLRRRKKLPAENRFALGAISKFNVSNNGNFYEKRSKTSLSRNQYTFSSSENGQFFLMRCWPRMIPHSSFCRMCGPDIAEKTI